LGREVKMNKRNDGTTSLPTVGIVILESSGVGPRDVLGGVLEVGDFIDLLALGKGRNILRSVAALEGGHGGLALLLTLEEEVAAERLGELSSEHVHASSGRRESDNIGCGDGASGLGSERRVLRWGRWKRWSLSLVEGWLRASAGWLSEDGGEERASGGIASDWDTSEELWVVRGRSLSVGIFPVGLIILNCALGEDLVIVGGIVGAVLAGDDVLREGSLLLEAGSEGGRVGVAGGGRGGREALWANHEHRLLLLNWGRADERDGLLWSEAANNNVGLGLHAGWLAVEGFGFSLRDIRVGRAVR
jgi:hypothetical protein